MPENRAKTGVSMLMERSDQGRFVKGVSGNPGGRPREIHGIRDLARQYAGDAIETLASIAKNPKLSASARVAAASCLLDRAFGKSIQYSENVNMNGNLEEFLDRVAQQTREDLNDRNEEYGQGYKSDVEDL